MYFWNINRRDCSVLITAGFKTSCYMCAFNAAYTTLGTSTSAASFSHIIPWCLAGPSYLVSSVQHLSRQPLRYALFVSRCSTAHFNVFSNYYVILQVNCCCLGWLIFWSLLGRLSLNLWLSDLCIETCSLCVTVWYCECVVGWRDVIIRI